MSIHIFGIGIGLFILILIWTLTIGTCIIVSKSKGLSYLGTIAFVISCIITILLIWIPREPPMFDHKADIRIYDSTFVWRIILIIIMAIFCVFGFLSIFSHWMEPIVAKQIKGTEKWTAANN